MLKISKNAAIQVITGNRLEDGAVIFLTPAGKWSTNVDESDVAHGPEQAEQLTARAAADEKARKVVAPYLIAVSAEGGRVQPLINRERIRAFGPSNVEGASERLAL